MKTILILTTLFYFTGQAFGACSSPISRTNSSANTVLTSTKYNTDVNTVYTHVNNMDGDCIQDSSIEKAKLAAGYKDFTVTAVTTTYAALLTDDVISASASGGAFSVTLPTAVGISGRTYLIKKTDSSANAVTIDPNAAETIDGVATYLLEAQHDHVRVTSNGTNWITGGSTGMSTPGISKPKTCYYAFGGASATLASPTVCSTGTCVEVFDSCKAISPPSRSSAGVYADLTIANGTFAANSFIDCKCKSWATAASSQRDCDGMFETGDNTWATNSSGGYVLGSIGTHGSTGTYADTYVSFVCEGSAP